MLNNSRAHGTVYPVSRVPWPVSRVPMYFGLQDLSRMIERKKNKINCLNNNSKPSYKVSKTHFSQILLNFIQI